MAEAISKREANKIDKRRRIIAAASASFAKLGYERTTLRQVAVAAGVGVGTLFLYAKTKEDLLVMVFQKEIRSIIDEAVGTLPGGSTISRICYVCAAVTAHHQLKRELGAVFLKELAFVSKEYRGDVIRFISDWKASIARIIEEGQVRGEVRGDVDANLLAGLALDIFTSELRRWAADPLAEVNVGNYMPVAMEVLLTCGGPRVPEHSAAPAERTL